MAGSEKVGKSCIVNQFIQNKPIINEQPIENIEYIYEIKTNTLKSNTIVENITNENQTTENNNNTVEQIHLEIVDIQAKKRMSMLSTQIYENIDGILLVFDLTDWKTFESTEGWIQDIKKYVTKNATVFLVGNKSDATTRRVIPNEECQRIAQESQFQYVEVSSRNHEQVVQLFDSFIHQLIIQSNKGNENRKMKIRSPRSLRKSQMNEQMNETDKSTSKNISSDCCFL